MKSEWDILFKKWQARNRTRDSALQLLFLAWYSCSEPTEFSGLSEDCWDKDLIEEIFEFLGAENSDDPEMLFVVSVMSEVAPECLGKRRNWELAAVKFRQRLAGKVPNAESFLDRGSYGEYFAHQARRTKTPPANKRFERTPR